MSSHNICFHEEIKKSLCGYPLLSKAVSAFIFLLISSHNFVTLQAPYKIVEVDILKYIFFLFHRKYGLTFQVNHLPKTQCT